MIGIVVPAHNEEEEIAGCLEALLQAANHQALNGEPVKIIVVLDHCTDDTPAIAARYPVEIIAVAAKNVGLARATGAIHAMKSSCRWLAFTDADTRVPRKWLAAQLLCRTDAVCGTVRLRATPAGSIDGRLVNYHNQDGHRHVHGCNFGVSASAYFQAGGFPSVRVHEDVQLVQALLATGRSVAWVADPCVSTSARQVGRLRDGFACSLRRQSLTRQAAA